MIKSRDTDILLEKLLHGQARIILIYMVMSVFISIALDGVTAFACVKICEIHVNACIAVKVIGGMSSCNDG